MPASSPGRAQRFVSSMRKTQLGEAGAYSPEVSSGATFRSAADPQSEDQYLRGQHLPLLKRSQTPHHASGVWVCRRPASPRGARQVLGPPRPAPGGRRSPELHAGGDGASDSRGRGAGQRTFLGRSANFTNTVRTRPRVFLSGASQPAQAARPP